MNKERILLIVVVLILGLFINGDLKGGDGSRRSRSRGESLEYIAPVLPAVDVALPDGEREGRFERDLFSPPSDTEPLAALSLEPPQLQPLDTLLPPSAYGPVATRMGDFLREPFEVEEIDGLFGREELVDDGGLGTAEEQSEAAVQAVAVNWKDLGSDERAELTAGWRRQYDTLLVSDYKYGTIQNADRYGLFERPEEAIILQEVDPLTGQPKFGGKPITYTPDRFSSFGFAETTTNQLELRFRKDFSKPLSPGQLENALEFARECVELRLESERALEIAEDVFAKAEAISNGDPRPRLGLARCYEAGFRFEEALAIYEHLLEHDDKSPVVLARLAELLARFRVFTRAEGLFGEAVRWGSSNYEARWRYGRFLLEAERPEEAVAQLEKAVDNQTTASARERVAMRTDLGWALLQAGRAQEAGSRFQSALGLDANYEPANAGLLSVKAVMGEEALAEPVSTETEVGFDLLHARGLLALRQGDWGGAKEDLERAVEASPFDATLPLRALAWLAARTGHPDEAFGYIERAAEIDPTDTYVLYLRGRLLAERDDLQEAAASLQAALDRELRFPEALAAMAMVQERMGDHEAAERYFERSLMHDPDQIGVHMRRGYNLLELQDVTAADASFAEALRRNPDEPSARLGQAWCAYLGEDPYESLTLYADVIESRRAEGEDDPFVQYAEVQIQRVRDHLDKELWLDRFDRASGVRLGNGWNVDQRQGLEIRLQEGRVVMEGMARTGGRTRLYQELTAGRYVSHEMKVTVDPSTGAARVGVFLAREREARGESVTQAEIALGRSPDGNLGYRVIQRGETDPLFTDVPTSTTWGPGQTLALRLEREGDGSDSTFTLYVDGVPVLEDVRVPSLGSASSALRFGVFVEIEANRSAKVFVDDVEVTRRQSL